MAQLQDAFENGKMVGKTYHVEDWMGAARQLRATN